MTPTNKEPRGYALLIVMLAATILAAISVSLVTAASADRMGSRIQMNTVRALYAAESGSSVAVKDLADRLSDSTDPSLVGFVPPSMPGVSFPEYSVRYIDPTDWSETDTCSTDADCASNACGQDGNCQFSSVVTLDSGDYAGLVALQTPVQVLVTAEYKSARATVGDLLELNLIPIFQFAIFFDGDLEFQSPPSMTITGPTHTNGNFVPFRDGSTPSLFFNGRVTVAGEQKRCTIYGDGMSGCIGPGDSGVQINGITLNQGIEDNSPTQQATYHATFGEFLKDTHRGVNTLTPPIPLSVTRPDVTSRPDVCGNNTTANAATFEQGIGIHLVRRPDTLYSGATYVNNATNAHEETYGPRPAAANPAGISTSCGSPSAPAAHFAHCQTSTSVPAPSFSQTSDDPAVAEQRLYWQADVRIIDGVWRDKNNDVIFNPETWDLRTANPTQELDDHVRLGHAFARVLRYSWFWDPRENRLYNTSPAYHRGLQMRVTDFDMQAFDELIDIDTAETLIFPDGPPADGVTVYISETFDPTFDDDNTNLDRVSNVRNFLNFHAMDGDTGRAAECLDVGATHALGTNLSPCELGWHPSSIWGDHLMALGGDPLNDSLLTPGTPNFATQGDALNSDISSAATGDNCYDPSIVPVGNPIAPTLNPGSAPAPCILATVQPVGPENAVRVIRGQSLPAIDGDPKMGFTLATDNRLYIYGDINVQADLSQDIPGKVAFIADSVTILSQRFNDMVMQRGGSTSSTTGWENTPQLVSYPTIDRVGNPSASPIDPTDLIHVNGGNSIAVTAGFNGGDAANVCLAWNAIGSGAGGGTTRYRRSANVSINASLLMGDVPSCSNVGGPDDGGSSGGVNNFPRFLEDNENAVRAVTILGSIVSLFRAEQGNSRFLKAHNETNATAAGWAAAPAATAASSSYNITGNRGCIYNPPTRNWSFDTALATPSNLPPSTPRLVDVNRVRWVRR